MKTTRFPILTISAALALGGLFAPMNASAMDFAGKTVNIIVGAKPGGGADKYARLFAPFIKKHLPGKPTVLVVNKPGGGNLKAANWFHRNAKPDGFTIVTITTSMHTHLVFGGKKIKFNELEWRPIILSPRGTVLYARTEWREGQGHRCRC